MKKVIFADYGKNRMIKKRCSICRRYAFVIDGKYACCGKKDAEDYIESGRVRIKRESGGTGRRNHLSKKEKEQILAEQKNKCIYCDCDLTQEEIHFDHFIPFSFTYTKTDPIGFVAACADCNMLKSNKIFDTPEEVSEYVKEESKKRKQRRR